MHMDFDVNELTWNYSIEVYNGQSTIRQKASDKGFYRIENNMINALDRARLLGYDGPCNIELSGNITDSKDRCMWLQRLISLYNRAYFGSG